MLSATSNKILDTLVSSGFNYILAKTYPASNHQYNYSIVLTPIRAKPDIDLLSDAYDTYFNLRTERKHLAEQLNGAEILLNGSEQDLAVASPIKFPGRKTNLNRSVK